MLAGLPFAALEDEVPGGAEEVARPLSDAPSLFQAVQEIGGATPARRTGASSSAPAPREDPWAPLATDVSTMDPALIRSVDAAQAEWREIHRRTKAQPPPSAVKPKDLRANLSDSSSHPWARYNRLRAERGPFVPKSAPASGAPPRWDRCTACCSG